jgi:hypothetical protein
MGTHSLSAKYNSVTGALKASLTGTNYQLPDLGASDAEMLIGRRVALVTTHGPELPEFDVPLTYLRERGAVVDVDSARIKIKRLPGGKTSTVESFWNSTGTAFFRAPGLLT